MKLFKKFISVFMVMQIMMSAIAPTAFCFEDNLTVKSTFDNDVVKSFHDGPINIAIASDNNYTYPLIVTMTSILESKNRNTKIDFYIMLSGDFKDENKAKIMSLKNKYRNCNINLIDMQNKSKEAYTSRHIKSAAYYRLILGSLLPQLDKILYLDSDLIVLQDLSPLYNVDLGDNYLGGILDTNVTGKDISWRLKHSKNDFFVPRFGKEAWKNGYVNSGVLLYNLKKIREDALEPNFIDSATKYKHICHDQDVLNIMCHNRIHILPNKYNRASYLSQSLGQTIFHYLATNKPWNNKYIPRATLWWHFANKSGFIKDIKAKHKCSRSSRKNKKRKHESANSHKRN